MNKGSPSVFRSSYFISKEPSPEGQIVTVFLAEKNDDGTLLCLKDGFVSTEGNIYDAEIGRSSGESSFDIEETVSSIEAAIEWIEKQEAAARASGVYDVEEYAGKGWTHVAEVKKARQPVKMPPKPSSQKPKNF